MTDSNKYHHMAQLCIEKFQSLSKTGKPLDNQWTTLCGLICEQSDKLSLVCLTTGTKCVTGSPSKIPNIIIDCHAEVLCKRAFKQHLMSLLAKQEGFSGALDNMDWHLFISQLPCGTIDRYQGPSKKDTDHGINRKPGRGEPCVEASCIDKILKWSVLGLQGKKLIALTRRPIRLKSLIVGNCVETMEFDLSKVNKALTIELSDSRALQTALQPPFNVNYQQPEIHFVETIKCSPFIRFNHLQACPSAIVCWNENGDKCEIVVEGMKQGVNKKRAESNPLRISREGLERRFNQLIEMTCDQDCEASQSYKKTWEYLKSLPRFSGWKSAKLLG